MGEAVAKADEALFCVHSRSDGGVVCGGASGGVVVWNEGRVEFHQGHEGGTFVVSDSMSGGRMVTFASGRMVSPWEILKAASDV